jgi:tetratricopeptide (TPR) repeat protein
VKRGVEYAIRTGHARGSRLRWREAADLFTRATELQPNDPVLLFYVAALRLQLGDADAYRAACRQLLAYAMGPGSNRPDYTERAAKAMLLDPDLKPGVELYATQQAMRSVELGVGSGLEGWLHLVEGMARYRQRKYDPAVAALKTSQAELKDAPAGRLLAEFVLAMAQHRAGDVAAARSTYDAAAALMPADLGADPNADWGPFWIDWLDASIAQREAKQVLGVTPAAR